LLTGVGGELGGLVVLGSGFLGSGFVVAAQPFEQVAAHAGDQVVAVEGGPSWRASTISSAACGRITMLTATARLSSTTGEGSSYAGASSWRSPCVAMSTFRSRTITLTVRCALSHPSFEFGMLGASGQFDL
jgi:hypothetical protein